MDTKTASTGAAPDRAGATGIQRPGQGGVSRRHRHSRTIAVALVLALIGAGAALLLRDDGSDAAAEPPGPITNGATLPILTPTDAALALYIAWQRGDSSEAHRASTDSGAQGMLELPTTVAAGLAFAGCVVAPARTESCSWERVDARLTMSVTDPAHGRPQVTAVTFTRS